MSILTQRYRSAKTQEERTGATYVLAGALIPPILGVSIAVVDLASIDLPDLTIPAAAIGFLLVGYGVLKHGNYILTATATAEDILYTMADALFLVNSEGEIILANKAASQLLEYEDSELAGKRMETLVQDSHTMTAIFEVNSPTSLETDLRTKNGRAVPAFVSKSAITTKPGIVVGYVLICRDITDRKHLEAQLAQAQRMAAVGEAAAMVGHDLRNPLQATAGTLYLARKLLSSEKVEGKTEAVELLQKLNDQIYYMDKIVSDLQDYARPIGAELLETDLPDLIREAIVHARTPENVQISTKVDSEHSKATVNPVLLRRVLTNLMFNAVQAMPSGGKLTVTAIKEQQSSIITVQDSGIGIPMENLEKIFNPFFTTKAQGQGLGLTVCKRLVEAQGGKITVTSEVGKGSTFIVKIPSKGTAGAT